MKKWLILIFIIMIFTATGCGKDENKRQINVLNWSSYIPSEIIIDFEKETGIKVNYSTYSSNEELLAKISNAAEGTYDLIFPSDYMVEIMKNRNMLEKLEKDKLLNIENLNDNYLGLDYDSENMYSLPFLAASTVIAVNKNIIKEEITSYNDLLNEEYKNEIVFIDDQRIIIGLALLANGYDMNSTNENELNIAKNWLNKLKKNIKAYDSDSPKNFLISKEASISVLWNAEASLAKLENDAIEIVFPNEGFALSIDNFTIPKGAKHKEETYQFIDYILRGDIMAKIVSSYPYKSINKEADLLLNEDYLNNPASNISDDIMKKGIFVKNIGLGIKMYDEIWAQIK